MPFTRDLSGDSGLTSGISKEAKNPTKFDDGGLAVSRRRSFPLGQCRIVIVSLVPAVEYSTLLSKRPGENFSTMLKLLLGCLALRSWTDLESKILPEILPPIYSSTSEVPDNYAGVPILFRDKDGLSPNAQRIWLALELKDVEYVTVLVDEQGDENVKLQWPDGSIQTDVKQVLESIEANNNDREPELYKRISLAVDNVRDNMMRLDPVMPRNTEPSLYAPYIFRDGGLTSRDSHMVSLEEVDEILEEYDDGPYFCGDFISAADIFWAPILERYVAQLPLTQDGDMLEPRYGGRYEAIEDWFKAMESIPCYACRIGGDSVTWENVFKEAFDQNLVNTDAIPELLPSRGKRVLQNRKSKRADTLWKKYQEKRPYLARTPTEECAVYILRNRDQIMVDAQASLRLEEAEVDEALREMIEALLGQSDDVSKMSGNARDVTTFLDNRIRAPRDMGILPAAALRALSLAAPKPRIKA